VTSSETDFVATRFLIRRRLGEGAVGVVYLAHDLEKKQDVALKSLRRSDALALYRFKQEFRSLADVSHPNLASIYELVHSGDEWFFTMELVDGVDFLSYVRPAVLLVPPGTEIVRDTLIDRALVTTDRGDGVSSSRRVLGAPETRYPLDETRLRRALVQLARGTVALHDAGKLHRDIKPTNVLVTKDHRVVLLDFGLVTELSVGGLELGGKRHVCGTAGYMSPEQAGAVDALSPASDWYSVGVVFYEALTGTLPFTGSVAEVLEQKQKYETRAPKELAPHVAPDLDRLCFDLLKRKPEDRPSGREILERLGDRFELDGPIEISTTASAFVPLSGPLFIGRDTHLEALRAAFSRTQAGHAVAVIAEGPSGVGKSALLKKFRDELSTNPETIVLSGRCYERESVPFKALDALIDVLSGWLISRTDAFVERILPKDVTALARLFPVLTRVKAISRAMSGRKGVVDPQELRRRAFLAMRELLTALSREHRVVLSIDDVQWSDRDSNALLSDVLRPPQAPPILLLASYRPIGDVELPLHFPPNVEVQHLEVSRLTEEEARSLAMSLLAPILGSLPEHADTIARESGGNPFFVAELVRYLQLNNAAPQKITLDEVLGARIAHLPHDARRLLALIAVAGGPIELGVVALAANLDNEDKTTIPLLRTAHLVRTRGSRGHDRVECFHDRVKTVVLASLKREELAGHHLSLAQAIEMSDLRDLEGLAMHYRGAGRLERAAQLCSAAAGEAAESLAFERAARLLRLSLSLHASSEGSREIYARLGDALANAGRGADSATAYLQAARAAPAALSIERKRRAAEQFLRSGHVDRGMSALDEVLGTLGMRLATTPQRALASLLFQRARRKVRGLSFVEKRAEEIDPAVLAKVDACWSVALGLGMVDVIRSSEFQTRNLLLALDAGEPYRIARALAAEALAVATRGSESHAETESILDKAAAISAELDHPHALGMSILARGMAANLEGFYRRGRQFLERALVMFEERCTGVAWETSTSAHMALWALAYLGEIGELVERVPLLLHAANARGDLYAATLLTTGLPNLFWLANDDAESAKLILSEGMGRWSQRGFHLQHYNHLLAEVQVDLYLGDGATALRRLELRWPMLSSSLLLRVQQIRIEATHLRARAELACAVHGPSEDRARHLDRAERDAKAIEKEAVAWATPLATLVRSGIAALRGQTKEAIRLADHASMSFEGADMALYAAIARLRAGELDASETGKTAVEAANRWMYGQRIRRPDRFADMLAPARAR
jgi:serine/threonine protein kinase